MKKQAASLTRFVKRMRSPYTIGKVASLRMACFALIFSLLFQGAIADEPFAYKGFTPGQMTFDQFRAKENPQADNDFRSEPRPVRCGPEKAGTKTMNCAESTDVVFTWQFVDDVLSSVFSTIDSNDFRTVLHLFADKYGSSYVTAHERLTDANGRAVDGYHTYTWSKDGREIKLWEYWRSPGVSAIEVDDLKLSEMYRSRLNHVSI